MTPLLLLPLLFADLSWEADYEAARSRATDEGRVIFVAVHSDDEARSKHFWKKVYKDKALRPVVAETVNVLACLDIGWQKRCECAKAGDLDDDEAKFSEAALREEFLLSNDEGVVASPQHLWIDSKGAVLLCVPYEMEASELAWCFAEAARLAGTPVPEVEGRAPRRLLYGSAYQPPDGDEYGRGLRPDEVKEKLDEMRSSMGGGGGRGGRGGGGRDRGGWGRRIASLLQLTFTDEKDAQEYVALELGSGFLTWGGTGPLVSALHGLGNLGPKSAWETFDSYADHREPEVRNECAVAAEQLGASEALRTVKTGLKREKDPLVEKNWLRALGAVAGKDKGARKILLDVSEDEDPLLRRNALFALGWLPQGEDVRGRLMEALGSDEEDDVRAAACGMALSREGGYLPVLQKRAQAEGLAEATRAALTAAAEVIEGAGLAAIESTVQEVCRDRVARERVFFRQVSAELGGRDGGGRDGGGRDGGGRDGGGRDGGGRDGGDGDR